jgi:uncharacterized protein
VKESVSQAHLDPAPLDPADVVDGEPQAASTILRQSEDLTLQNGIWECTPGTFYLPHNYEEQVTVLKGRVTVTPEGGEPVELEAGDTAFFEAGTRVLWEVHDTVRKSWHIYDETGTVFAAPEE